MLQRYYTLALMALVLFVSGCAQPVQEVRQRFFWPIGVTDPKIEYINFYESNIDLKRGEKARFSDAILGKQVPVRIFANPIDIDTLNSRQLYVTDQDRGELIRLDLDTQQFDSLQTSGGETSRFLFPVGVALDGPGGGYMAAAIEGKIYRFDDSFTVVAEFGQGELKRPTGLKFDRQNNLLYVVDTTAHSIKVYSPEGEFIRSMGKRGGGEGDFNFPVDMDIDPDGNLYVADAGHSVIKVFGPDGAYLREFGERGTSLGSFSLIKGIAVDRFGHVFVTDGLAHRFVVFDYEGNFLDTIGGRSAPGSEGVSPGSFSMPKGIETTADGAIWVVDSLNKRIHKFQFLTREYLEKDPILPGQAYIPESFFQGSGTSQ